MTRVLVALAFVLFASGWASAERRVALVIGNAGYVNAAVLKNPVNDATDVASALERLGFEVVLGTDLDQSKLRRTVKRYSEMLVGADVAVFFYAGHAVQVDGQNYLAPIDTDLERESDLDFETISLDLVKRQMEREARTLIFFLDACRDNPLTRRLGTRSRSTGNSKGLARLDANGEGTFIAYATQPDNVALDGAGRNSPFTTALLANIERPGVEISELMTDVRRSVYEETGERQLPWTNSSLLGQFYFKDALPSETDPAQAERDRKLERLELEAQVWETIRNSTDSESIRQALKELGEGPYAELARARLATLEAQKSVTAAVAKATGESSAEQPSAGAAPVGEDKPVAKAAPDPAPQPGADEEKPVEVALAEIPGARDGADKAKPTNAEPSRELVRSIQKELQRVGCDPGSADGVWGRRSRSALGDFSRHGEVDLALLEPDDDLLDTLKSRQDRVCPLQCGRGQVEKDGRCVADASARAPQKKTASAARRSTNPARRSTSNCMRFNGQLICD